MQNRINDLLAELEIVEPEVTIIKKDIFDGFEKKIIEPFHGKNVLKSLNALQMAIDFANADLIILSSKFHRAEEKKNAE